MKRYAIVVVFFISTLMSIGCAETPEPIPDNDRIRCAEQNGTCTADPTLICAGGTQPYSVNDPEYTDCLGHCCIEPSMNTSCNPKPTDTDNPGIPSYNCVPDDDGIPCSGRWGEVEGNLTCEDGRSCCYWPM